VERDVFLPPPLPATGDVTLVERLAPFSFFFSPLVYAAGAGLNGIGVMRDFELAEISFFFSSFPFLLPRFRPLLPLDSAAPLHATPLLFSLLSNLEPTNMIRFLHLLIPPR